MRPAALADADYRRRLIDHKMENQAFQLTVRRAADEAQVEPGSVGGQLDHEVRRRQDRPGAHRADRRGDGRAAAWAGRATASTRDELASVRGWLRAKANSIEGGSSEINLNVVSKRVLGLPDPKTN